MNAFAVAFTRKIRIGWRHPLDTFNPMAFFLIVVSLFGFTTDGGAGAVHDESAIAFLWIVLLLSTMMASGSVFSSDLEDGSLEQMVAHHRSMYETVQGTVWAHWCLSSLPILALVPLGVWMLNLDFELWSILLWVLVPGSIVFTQFGVLGASLTLGVGRNGVLLALLVLPFYVPVLVLGIGACQRYINAEPYGFAVASVGAIAVAALTFLPFAVAALVRVSQEY